jgi:AcrR family transcriptional regulator
MARSKVPKIAVPVDSSELHPARRAEPRRPRQERGRVRVEALLDALESLIAERDFDEIGYYDIVQRAGMSAASVYHFFPSKDAVFMALAERYFNHFQASAERRTRSVAPKNWQDLLAARHQAAVEYYNSHKAAMKLIFGNQPFLEIRSADLDSNRAISNHRLEEFRRVYDLPNVKDVAQKFLTAVTISDAIWRVSFIEHGHITPWYAEEAIRATVAYFRTFLPEHLEPREAAGSSEVGR